MANRMNTNSSNDARIVDLCIGPCITLEAAIDWMRVVKPVELASYTDESGYMAPLMVYSLVDDHVHAGLLPEEYRHLVVHMRRNWPESHPRHGQAIIVLATRQIHTNPPDTLDVHRDLEPEALELDFGEWLNSNNQVGEFANGLKWDGFATVSIDVK